MEFIHTYLGYNNNQDEYNCEILNEIKNAVGYCKYYKSNSYMDKQKIRSKIDNLLTKKSQEVYFNSL